MAHSTSQVFIFPNTIIDEQIDFLNAVYYEKSIRQVDVFFVENIKPARQLLKRINKNIDIDSFEWVVLKHQEQESKQQFEQAIIANKNIGIISDSGCPCIADPGADFVFIAQQYHLSIDALVGPNSIVLALMSSGLNGQAFTFHGYLPIQHPDRIKRLQQIEQQSKQHHYTQIFIETPFRNQSLFNSILDTCQPHTLLCIASNVSGTNQLVKTTTLAIWKKQNLVLEKAPCIFLLLGQ